MGRYDNLSWMASNVREGGRERGHENQSEAELKTSVSLYLLPDRLDHAAGCLQARGRPFISSFVPPKHSGLMRHAGS